MSLHPDHRPTQASPWVRRFAPLVPPGEVLDLACGSGRHARYFAAAGYAVVALDQDGDALASISEDGIQTWQADLEDGSPWPFDGNRFSGIVITNYLHRPLFPFIFESLAPGGVLIVETFAEGNAQFGKPSNPDFLLRRGELLELAHACVDAALRVVAFEDGYVALPKPALLQRVCLVKLPFDSDFDNQPRRFTLF